MQAAFLAGVGIMAAHEGSLGQVMVVGVSEGHAAHQAGIDIGDEIIAIDGQQVAGFTAEKVAGMLLGDASSTVHLEIDSLASGRRRLTLTRGMRKTEAGGSMTQPALEPRFNFHRKKTPVTDMAHFRPLNAPHHPAFQGHAPGEQERDEATMKLWYTLTRMADGDTAYDPRTVHRLTSHLHPDEAREADLALARVAALLRRAEAVEGELASVYHEKLPRLEDRANEADERAKELEAQIADRNATVLRLEGRLADATQDVAHAHAELHAEFEARQGAERQIAELERLLAASNSATETLRGELGELRAQARQMNVVTEDLKFSVMDLKARANEAAGAQRKAEAAQAKAEFEASETMAELEHLRDMLEEQMANAADGEAGGEGEQSFGGSFSSKKGGGARRRSDADRAQARRAQEAKALGMQKQVDEALARAEAAQAERDEAKAELKRRAATEALAEERAAQVVLLHHTVEDLGEQLRDVEAQRDALVEEMEELRRINLEATEHADIEKDKKIAYLQHEVEQHQVVALEQTRNAEAALQAIGELRGIEAAQAAEIFRVNGLVHDLEERIKQQALRADEVAARWRLKRDDVQKQLDEAGEVMAAKDATIAQHKRLMKEYQSVLEVLQRAGGPDLAFRRITPEA